jgi:hypothetical protein
MSESPTDEAEKPSSSSGPGIITETASSVIPVKVDTPEAEVPLIVNTTVGRGGRPPKKAFKMGEVAASPPEEDLIGVVSTAEDSQSRPEAIKQTDNILPFSSRYPRACRPARNDLKDIDIREHRKEEYNMLFEDEEKEQVEQKHVPKRRKTFKTATSAAEAADSAESVTEEQEDIKVLKEQLERGPSKVTRASSSTTLVSEDFASPARPKHHLRTPTSLSPAARASSPLRKNDATPSSPSADVEERPATLLPNIRRVHLPTPASLSPFPPKPNGLERSARLQNVPTSPLTDIDDLDDYQKQDEHDEEDMSIDEAGKTAKLEEIERQDEIFARKLFGVAEDAETAEEAIPAQIEQSDAGEKTTEEEIPLDDQVVEETTETNTVQAATPDAEENEDIHALSVKAQYGEGNPPALLPLPAEQRRVALAAPTPAAEDKTEDPLIHQDDDIPVPLNDEDDITVEELFLINKPSHPNLLFASNSLPRVPSFPSLHDKGIPSSLSQETPCHDWCILGPKASTDALSPKDMSLRRASDVSQIFGEQGLLDIDFDTPTLSQPTTIPEQQQISELGAPAAEQETQDVSALSAGFHDDYPSLSQDSPSTYFSLQADPISSSTIPASPFRITAISKSADPGLFGPFCNWLEPKPSFEDLSMELEFNFGMVAGQRENGQRLVSQFLGVDESPCTGTPAFKEDIVHEGYQDDFSQMLKTITEGALKKTVATEDNKKGRDSRAGSEDTVEDDSMRHDASAGFGAVSPRDIHNKTANIHLFQPLASPTLDLSLIRKQEKLRRKQARAEMKLVELEKRRSIDDGSLPPSPPQYDYEDLQPVAPGTSLDTMISHLEAAEPRIISKNKVSLTEQAEKEEMRNNHKDGKMQFQKSRILVQASATSSAKATKASARAKALVELNKNSEQRKTRNLQKEIKDKSKKRSIQQDDDQDDGVQSVTFKHPRLATLPNPPIETRDDAVQVRPTHNSGKNRTSVRNKRLLGAVHRATK